MNTLTLSTPFILKNRLHLKIKLNLKTFGIITSIFVLLFLIFYIFQINLVFSETNLIKNYNKKLNILIQENKNLEIQLAQLTSLNNFETKIDELGFEKVKEIHYISLGKKVAKINENKE